MVNDSISNLIIKLKNASLAKKETISVSYSKYTDAILSLLQKHGYIKSFSKKGKKVIKTCDVEIAYEAGVSKIQGVERVSKLSKRIYRGAKELKPVRQGFGFLVVSTSKGVMTGVEARKANLGGEPLFKIW